MQSRMKRVTWLRREKVKRYRYLNKTERKIGRKTGKERERG